MKKAKIIPNQNKERSMTFEELFETISHDWEQKAKNLQDRRWKIVQGKLG